MVADGVILDRPALRAVDGPDVLRILAAGAGNVEKAVRRAAELDFSHVLLSPPWRAAAVDGPYLTQDFSEMSQACGQPSLTGATTVARKAGVGLLLDVVLDRVAERGVVVGGPFTAPDQAAALDPRHEHVPGAARARLHDDEDAAALARWWAERLSGWFDEGVCGFRLLGLEALPDSSLLPFISILRKAVPAAILLPWTPVLTRTQVLGLRGSGIDGVFSSLPWWNGHADWLWDEVDDLLSVAPVLGMDGLPPGPGHGPNGRHGPALAAMLGQGWLHVAAEDDDTDALVAINNLLRENPVFAARVRPRLPAGGATGVVGLIRTDSGVARSASRAVVAFLNTDPQRRLAVSGAAMLTATEGAFAAFTDSQGGFLEPRSVITLAPGEWRVFAAAARQTASGPRADATSAREAAKAPRLAVERLSPCVDDGSFAVKAVVGEVVPVEADIIFDGHDKIAACLCWRAPNQETWCEARMSLIGNDRWGGALPLDTLGLHEYKVVAWRDRFETFRDEIVKKAAAGLSLTLELQEGEALVRDVATRPGATEALSRLVSDLGHGSESERLQTVLQPALAEAMASSHDRPHSVSSRAIPVDSERHLARFASWYEIFPRSMSDDPARHGTFRDVVRHLPRIRDMGFDVLYFPPISPIGTVNRKGRNNSLKPSPEDPGSPYAVGSADGGHDALHPELGTFEDFQALQTAAAAHGLEIAIDFAIQCSPDHPWLRAHRGWFDWRPDGSIKYAENPPKKYEDIVNVDFYGSDAIPDLWVALCDVVLFWAEQGIRIFRVDNPHTKPFPFWEWMIREVRQSYPETMFLAEAFTRPKIMYRLAKIGFSQSYTYFTWRNEKRELIDYLEELNEAPARDFFRPHFFVNTPDINPQFLQGSGRSGFLIRAALAATLSGLFGVYCGFELCEAAAVPGREEYLDSEKYQLRAWDWDRPGNIVTEIGVLNRIRRRNPALQTHLGLRFLDTPNERVLFFEKATSDRGNVVLVAISLDAHQPQEADIDLPLWSWGIEDEGALEMADLLTGEVAVWRGRRHRISLTEQRPYAIWRARPSS